MNVVPDSAGDRSPFQNGVEHSIFGPFNLSNHFSRDRLLRNLPGDAYNKSCPHRCDSSTTRSYSSHPRKTTDDSSESRLLLSMRQQERGLRRRIRQQLQRQEGLLAIQDQYEGDDLSARVADIDTIESSTEEKEENDPAMPPPNQAMTNLVLLQRHNRFHDQLLPPSVGLAAIREERGNDEDVEQQSIAYNEESSNPAITESISGNAGGNEVPVTEITAINSTSPPKNRDGYHFTILPDRTPVYRSLSPFRSVFNSDDATNERDGGTISYGEKEERRNYNTSGSQSQPQSLSPSNDSFNDVNGILYVDRSSSRPLAQLSQIISATEKSENGAVTSESVPKDFRHSRDNEEEHACITNSEHIVDDVQFASSSTDSSSLSDDNVVVGSKFSSSSIPSSISDSDHIVENIESSSSAIDSLSSSISSIAITANTDLDTSNENAKCQYRKKRKTEINRPSRQKKRCNGSDKAIESTMLADGTTSKSDRANTTLFKHIIGHQSVKLRLDEVLLPIALPSSLSRAILKGIRSLPASILMYGPPGCGKTQLAKAIAGEAHAAFLSIGPSDILSKYVGESEEAVRSVFAEAVRLARNNRSGNRCTVLFFDEIDALGQSRGIGSNHNGGFGGGANDAPSIGGSGQGDGYGSSDNSSRRILAELLIQLTNVNTVHGTYDPIILRDREYPAEEEKESETLRLYSEEEENMNGDSNFSVVSTFYEDSKVFEEDGRVKNRSDESRSNFIDNDNSVRVIVVAATNRPNDCDPALIRRFALQVKVGLPTAKDRRRMLKRSMEDIDHTITDKQFLQLSSITEGWSGSDLQSLAREAAMTPVRECIRRAALLKRQMFLSHSQREERIIDYNVMVETTSQEEKTPESQRMGERYSDSFTVPQKRLLEEFCDLRPVNFRDYKKALTFWFSRTYTDLNDSPLAKFGWIEDVGGNGNSNNKVALNEHYDSSSDEESEEEAVLIEGGQIETRNGREGHGEGHILT